MTDKASEHNERFLNCDPSSASIISNLLKNVPTAASINILVAIVTYFTIPSPSSMWLAVLLTTSIFRFFPLLLCSLARQKAKSCGKFYALILFTVFLQGSAWGYTCFELFNVSHEIYRFYLIVIACGMVGGAILSLTPSFAAFLCFSLPTTLPIIVLLVMVQQPLYTNASIMGGIYLFGVTMLSYRVNKSQLQLLLSQQQLQATSEELAEHKVHLEQLIEQRTAELLNSNERYRQLTEEINDVIYQVDGKGIIKYISPVIRTVLGYSPEELIGRHYTKIFHPEEIDKVRFRFKKVIKGDIHPTEYRLLHKNGSYKWIRASSRPILDGGVPVGIRGVLTDITVEKEAEKEKLEISHKISETQKLEAIGTLAGGIAHDFNNLLMGIQGRTTLIADALEPDDDVWDHIGAIEEYIAGATNLTSQLLGTVKGGKYDPKPTELNTLVDHCVAMFSRTRKELQIKFIPSGLQSTVEIDRRQMEQVLLNLLVNAWQAMPSGGKITLELKEADFDEAACAPYKVPAGRYAHLSVTDSGTGMDKETLQRIFDPFFTTKQKSRGTGLGLASAHGIIKNHNGFITVYSEPGLGTTFNIHLPLSEKVPRETLIVEPTVSKGSETILLVDDEKLILEVGEGILRTLGYTVLTAQGGEKALELIRLHGDRIDLVLLDMIMPQMDGAETFDKIRSLSPAMPVILSSGYAVNGQATEILQRGCNGFIQKPFTLNQLSQKIRSVLDNRMNRTSP